ncbi:MAG: T9SS type A sorting domain-containing protein [Muribaculaceae bacterium]|nr:T9SS type A sorting domain-containing protein [Muribaculaceae bacterium]
MVSKDCGETWEITNKNYCVLSRLDFDTRGSDRLYGTRDNILLYSDDFGANWSEMCQVGENSLDYIENFVQREDKIYAITKEYKVYQIDLSQIETSVEAIGIGNENVSVSVEGNNLRINSQSEISSIEIYSIGGIKLLSQKYASEGIDISDLLQGIYIARLQTADGRSLSIKFNK